jgi:RimJ/RimL family protein N-acetyltransferase
MLELRPMTCGDLPLFQKWLHAPHVAKWYHDPDDWMAEVKQQDGAFSWIRHFIAETDGRPVGFCQYYAAKDSDEEWLRALGVGGTYSIDYLIGEADALRRGYGRQIVARLTDEILRLSDARRIAAAPERENAASRALLCACGFAPAGAAGEVYVKELPR